MGKCRQSCVWVMSFSKYFHTINQVNPFNKDLSLTVSPPILDDESKQHKFYSIKIRIQIHGILWNKTIHLGGRVRQISVISKPAWSTELIP